MEIHIPFLNIEWILTWWKVWGICGALMFTGRWLVQMHFSRRAKRPVLPIGYWLMSLAGSFMLLTYFIFGKNDSVGILSNLFPSFVAGYNLWLELKHRKMNPVPSHV
ncbi:MAG: lipid-A-disaccharide synthase N-terminal domain-containing protein [Kiritimatiellia bacterium]